MNLKACIPKELIDKHRDINVQHEWWDYIEEAFEERMETKGIFVSKIYFSGFWSQGDGACFDGRIEDWGKYLRNLGYDDPILHALADEYWQMKWTHRGHYYHDRSVWFDNDTHLDDEWNPYDPDDLRHDMWKANIEQYHFGNLADEMKENIRGYMRELYRELEEEYNSLTSDEAVCESIIANDLLTLELEY